MSSSFKELEPYAIVANAIAGDSEPTIKISKEDTKRLRENYERVLGQCQAECDGIYTKRIDARVSVADANNEKTQCLNACRKVDMGVVSPLPQTCEEAVSSWGSRDDLQVPALECKGREPVLIEVGDATGKRVNISTLKTYKMSGR